MILVPLLSWVRKVFFQSTTSFERPPAQDSQRHLMPKIAAGDLPVKWREGNPLSLASVVETGIMFFRHRIPVNVVGNQQKFA